MPSLTTAWQIARTFGLRDGLLRAVHEAQRGTGLLALRMKSASGWPQWDLNKIAPTTSPDDLLNTRRQGAHPFFFSDVRNLRNDLQQLLGAEGEPALIAEANQILAGQLPYFGRLSLAAGFPPNWFKNPITTQQVAPNRLWTQMRFASPKDDYGDLKFILEPSRFLFLYPLARAYALTADERLPQAFWQSLESWHDANPPMSGPLWICGQECSLRIPAWSFALNAFLHSPATTPPRVAMLFSMIAAHAWRIMQTVGYARSQRSNHLVSEAVGLWTAGTLYPELREARTWQKRGSNLLREAVLDQITPEGLYLPHSFNYQRMVMQQLLWTLRLAEIHHIQLAPEIRDRTAAALAFIANFVDATSGRAPNHGSNDGSQILPLSNCDYTDYRPLLQTASRILNHETPLPPGEWDEPALWFYEKKVEKKEVEKKRVHHPSSAWEGARENTQLAKNAGYHRIGTKNSWALIKAAHYRRRPFQADQLQLDLWWRGLNLARDPGTYLYNGDPPWDNALATTAVHNTITVDRRDQMRRAGRFLWLDWAQASGSSFSQSPRNSSSELTPELPSTRTENHPNHFEGEHNGYRRLGVTHRRAVQQLTEDAWLIVDDLLGEGQHNPRLHWLLPDLPFAPIINAEPSVVAGLGPAQTWQNSVSPSESKIPNMFSATVMAENARIRWFIFSSVPAETAVIRAGKILYGNLQEYELLGWESPTYGELCPAVSLVYEVKAPLPVRLITAVLADDALQIEPAANDLILSHDASRKYKVSLSPTATAKPGA